jgi:hypothetical protein
MKNSFIRQIESFEKNVGIEAKVGGRRYFNNVYLGEDPHHMPAKAQKQYLNYLQNDFLQE